MQIFYNGNADQLGTQETALSLQYIPCHVSYKSAIKMHIEEDHNGEITEFDWAKVAKTNGNVERRICEAVWERTLEPELNRKVDCDGVVDLFFYR